METSTRPKSRTYVRWPPRVTSMKVLGPLVDGSQRSFFRDIGRSSRLGNTIIINFGDTVAIGGDGERLAITQSTAAIVQQPEAFPRFSSYLTFRPDGAVADFISPRPDEGDEPGRYRVALWCFGGIIDIGNPSDSLTAGWVFYQNTKIYKSTKQPVLQHTGVAKVLYNTDCDGLGTGRLQTIRAAGDGILFKGNEPSFGTFSSVAHEQYAYLFGHVSKYCKNVVLARVRLDMVTRREHYTFWDGYGYQEDITKVDPVLKDMQHGGIFKSSLFHGSTRSWVFVGCNFSGDNKIMMAASHRIEGPFDAAETMSIYGPDNPQPLGSPGSYCVYPHPWAFSEADGQLLVTWSEKGPNGNVVAAKIQFGLTMEISEPRPGSRLHGAAEHSAGGKFESTCCILL